MTVDAQTVTFLAPLPPPALRANSRTANHNYRAALVREYAEAVWCAGNAAMADGPRGNAWVFNYGWERAHVRLVWRHHRQGPDVDNALASLKPLIDVLHTQGARPLGIFRDDSPDCMSIAIGTEKVMTRAEEGVLVEVVLR
jgi:hypothetical protein